MGHREGYSKEPVTFFILWSDHPTTMTMSQIYIENIQYIQLTCKCSVDIFGVATKVSQIHNNVTIFDVTHEGSA